MNLVCVRCKESFDCAVVRGYCDACVEHFREFRKKVHARQRPAPNVYADGKFADAKECPETVLDFDESRTLCGLCGSDEIEPGYGLGSGYGMGSYNFCFGCNSFLDFREDYDE